MKPSAVFPALLLFAASQGFASAPAGDAAAPSPTFLAPAFDAVPADTPSRLRPLIARYRADRAALEHVRALTDEGDDPLFAPRRAALRGALVADW